MPRDHTSPPNAPRAWLYREQLRDILDRKQINVVSTMLKQWCTNVLRSKVDPMKDVAIMIRAHFDGITAWALWSDSAPPSSPLTRARFVSISLPRNGCTTLALRPHLYVTMVSGAIAIGADNARADRPH